MNCSIIALVAARAASPALAVQDYLPACSRIRLSFLLDHQTQPFLLDRRMLAILSDPRTQSTRWTIIAMGSLRGHFAVWRKSGGRTPSAITLTASRRCDRPPGTSQMSDGLNRLALAALRRA